MPYPSGEPPWQTQILDQLSSEGKLSGINPDIIGAIAQEESGFEDAGAGYNSAGYGGYFGLGANSYPGGNSETVAQLLTNSPASFTQQAITAAAAFNSYLSEAGGSAAGAESIYQTGKLGETGGGVALVEQALGQSSPGGGGAASTGTPPTSSTAGGSASAAGSGSSTAVKLTGVAGVLQSINDLMNPSKGGTLENLETLGTANVAAIVETIVFRGLFTIAFLGVAYVGLKQITGGSSSVTNTIIQPIQQAQKNDLAQQRIDTAKETAQSRERNVERTAQSRETVAATPKQTTITHVKGGEATAASGAAATGVESVAADLAEGALLV